MPFQRPFLSRATPYLALTVSLMASGCAVGPNFIRPAAPEVSGYTASPVTVTVATPGVDAGNAQSFASGADVTADWWTLFHSPALNDLIKQSLESNHDLKAAQAALQVAHETVLAQRGAFLPSVTAGFSATRTKTSSSLAPTPSTNAIQYSLYTPEVSVAYSPDVFGLNRRTRESVQAQEQAARYQAAATYLTLTSNVANALIEAASLQSQIEATHELIGINNRMVDTLTYQVSKGYASPQDLAAQQAQLAQLEATLPPLLNQLAQQHDLLAALTGRFPSQAPAENLDLSSLTLPEDLPLSLPSALVEQRPDILQAEANMRAANAQVGVAAANRLPNIQLTGDAGNSALALHDAFGPGVGFWDLGAAITAPIFDGGTLLHQERAAKANYVEVNEQYRSTVLTAFQNVADTLAALQHDAEGLNAASASETAAKTSLDILQQQSRVGYAGNLAVLSAEQAYQQARISRIQAQASRFADTVALYQALGGGWWHRADLTGDKNAK